VPGADRRTDFGHGRAVPSGRLLRFRAACRVAAGRRTRPAVEPEASSQREGRPLPAERRMPAEQSAGAPEPLADAARPAADGAAGSAPTGTDPVGDTLAPGVRTGRSPGTGGRAGSPGSVPDR